MNPPENSPTTPARNGLARGQFVGVAAAAFALLWVVENVLFAVTGAPGYGDPIEDVLAYYAANRVTVAVISGLVAVYLPLLLVFLAGLHTLVVRRGGAGAAWSRLAVAAGATLSATLVLFNVLQIGLAVSAGELAEPTHAFEIVWQVHAASFGLALPMLAVTCIGGAIAAHSSGLTPTWQLVLGLVGGGMMLAAGLHSLAIADGSPLIFVGLIGFVAWIVWLLVTSVRLIRSGKKN